VYLIFRPPSFQKKGKKKEGNELSGNTVDSGRSVPMKDGKESENQISQSKVSPARKREGEI
jgi:hypothetical protein